jgi:predicted GNAT superfamily acetyltransferase
MAGVMPDPMQIRPLAQLDQDRLLALNNAHAVELSWLDIDRLASMLRQAWRATGIGDLDAALIAFDQSSGYDGWSFGWFRDRYPRFVYVDRVVVAPSARGRGLARALYADLFAAASAAGQALVTCEVNSDPPNPASDRFHAALGFAPVGSAQPPGAGKTLRYLARALP